MCVLFIHTHSHRLCSLAKYPTKIINRKIWKIKKCSERARLADLSNSFHFQCRAKALSYLCEREHARRASCLACSHSTFSGYSNSNSLSFSISVSARCPDASSSREHPALSTLHWPGAGFCQVRVGGCLNNFRSL